MWTQVLDAQGDGPSEQRLGLLVPPEIEVDRSQRLPDVGLDDRLRGEVLLDSRQRFVESLEDRDLALSSGVRIGGLERLLQEPVDRGRLVGLGLGAIALGGDAPRLPGHRPREGDEEQAHRAGEQRPA
jgi:hypothetical protein